MLLVAFAATGAIAALFLRSMGVTRDHPRIRQLASRPWRDGQAVLRVAIRHLHDMFVITPSGSLFAPNSVEIQMNPEDLVSLCDQMELAVVIASVTEVYEEQVVRYGARFATPERAEVYVVADEWVPRGRYRLRQGHLQVLQRRVQPWVRQLAGLEPSTLHKGIIGLKRERLARVPAGHLPVDQQRLALAVGHQPHHHKGLLARLEILALDHGRTMAAE